MQKVPLIWYSAPLFAGFAGYVYYTKSSDGTVCLKVGISKSNETAFAATDSIHFAQLPEGFRPNGSEVAYAGIMAAQGGGVQNVIVRVITMADGRLIFYASGFTANCYQLLATLSYRAQ